MDTRKRRKEGGVLAPTLESLQASPKRARVHAQRKFAQGSQPNSPAPTPVKETRELRERNSGASEPRTRSASQALPPPPPLDLVEVPVRPTVEDFLTFLCYRGTSLLPPGLEHFNNPQLMELAAESRGQSPARDDKGRLSKRRNDGFTLEKKDRERELSKESVKKNLDQTETDGGSYTIPYRVTRSTPHPPPPAATTAAPATQPSATPPPVAPTPAMLPHTRKKLSERLMIKKTLMLQNKAKSMRLQDRKSLSLRRCDVPVVDSMVATRSGRLLQKYRVSATTALARKKARVAFRSSIRPKQKLSRILQRLGGSAALATDSRVPRTTRSQAEGRDSDRSERSDKGEAKMEGKAKGDKVDKGDGVKAGRKEDGVKSDAPRLPRPVRLVRQKLQDGKYVVKKVVRVTREGTKNEGETNHIDTSPTTTSLNNNHTTATTTTTTTRSPDQVPLAKRLRRSTLDANTPTHAHTNKKSPNALTNPHTKKATESKTDGKADGTSNDDKSTTSPTTSVSPLSLRSHSSDNQSSASSPELPNLMLPKYTTHASVSSSAKALSAVPSPASPSASPHKTRSSTPASLTTAKFYTSSASSGSSVSRRLAAGGKEEKVTAKEEKMETEEIEKYPSVRVRPSRRSKELAVAYRQLGSEGRSGSKALAVTAAVAAKNEKKEEEEDEEGEEEKKGMSSVTNLRTHVRSKDAEGDEKTQSSGAEQAGTGDSPGKAPSSDTTPGKAGIRKCLRRQREAETEAAESVRVTRRTPSTPNKDESPGSGADDSGRVTSRRLRRDRGSQDVITSPDTPTKPTATAATPTRSAETSPAASRSLRRTRSDADETLRKASVVMTRRASLEVDTKRKPKPDTTNHQESDGGENERSPAATRSKRDTRRTGTTEVRKPEDSDKMIRPRVKKQAIEIQCIVARATSPEIPKPTDLLPPALTTLTPKTETEEQGRKNSTDGEDDSKTTLAQRIMAEGERMYGQAGKSQRAVTQDRKTLDQHVPREGVRQGAARRSLDKSDSSSEAGEPQSRSGSRSRSGSLGGGTVPAVSEPSATEEEISTLNGKDKKAPVSQSRRKSIGGRRRSSNHDEAKLNEVLESVAKDFERDIDGDHYEKMEHDLMMGNKSPDKPGGPGREAAAGEGGAAETGVGDEKGSNASNGSNPTDAAGVSRGGAGQGGGGSPSPGRRGAGSKKLNDVVRSLQKKQAETPGRATPPLQNPTFLRDLGGWTDKQRQQTTATENSTIDEPDPKTPASPKPKPRTKAKDAKGPDEDPPTRRRSGRATTLASTRATESDLMEIEEQRRSRKARRVAAALAKEEAWSSSSEAPLSPQMSPDTLRGWPPPRLTSSPTPSQSSEGTTSSTPSQRSNRLSSRSRRQSPANNYDFSLRPSVPGAHSVSRSSAPSTPASQTSQGAAGPSPGLADKTMADPKAGYTCDNSLLTRAPSFFPSEEEFTDPLDYIEKIRPEAEQFGVCRIVPPSNFKPECRVNDDMRFTGNNQYIQKMMHRWGPNVRTLRAIRRCLAKQNIELTTNPLIGCMELDLVRLYEVVEQHGGLMSVIENELWGKVADACRIPRSAQERITKLDSIYCKYLLPYATLSSKEREELLAEVDSIHTRSLADSGSKKPSSTSSDNEEEEEEEESLDCIVKGKSTALSTFYRIARNTSNQWQPDPASLEVDERYWSLVVNGSHHVCVLSASIDTSEHGYGFPSHRSSPLAKHPWNLKNLCQNPNSILKSMGTIVGVTAPTLHVGMLFSTVCWYKDPHSLPWIEYLHTGASKIWYGVAANQEDKLYAALKKIVPDFVKDSAIWLPSDTAMVPPSELVREGVRVCRVVQEPGQFVVVFPGAFTSSICKGYLISESAFFARPQYFDRAVASFKALRDCCEPSMFSLERLVLSVVTDPRSTLDGLLRARDLVLQVVQREKDLRARLAEIGLEASERLSTPDSHRKKKSRFIEDEEENMCEMCRQNLYVALVTNSQEEAVYCLEHALTFLTKNPSHLEYCKLMYTYSLSELDGAVKQMEERIHIKSGKKVSPTGKKNHRHREHLDSFSSSTSSSNL